MITQTLPAAPTHFSEADRARFASDGYLAVADLLTPDEVETAKQAFRDLLQSHTDGRIPARWHLPAHQPGEAVLRRSDSKFAIHTEPGWDPTGHNLDEIEAHIRKYWHFENEHPLFQSMLAPTHRMQGLINSLLGPDPILFQAMALVKPPFVGRAKPWHQDNAYFAVTPLDQVIGIWIALDDAEVENGCMHVIPGGHRLGSLRHHHDRDCEIMPGRFDPADAIPIPIPAGGALFFYGMLPHETPPNRSALRRRAMQFHYRGRDTQMVDRETYDKVFAEADGTPASCAAARG